MKVVRFAKTRPAHLRCYTLCAIEIHDLLNYLLMGLLAYSVRTKNI